MKWKATDVLRPLVLLLTIVSVTAVAQEPATGRVAGSTAGVAGERRTRDDAVAGIKPLARIDSRIQNRVQSRIRNRIDRNYDPQANATSPFEVAGEQVRRAAGRSTRR